MHTAVADHSIPAFAGDCRRNAWRRVRRRRGFVNDALEETAGPRRWSTGRDYCARIGEHFVLAVGAVQRNFGLLFELADFQSAARRSFKSSTSFLSISSMRRRQSLEVHGRAPRHRRPRTTNLKTGNGLRE